MRHHPRVDVLVNNAGIAVYQPSLMLSAEDMRRQFEVNVFAAFCLTRALLPALTRSDAGYVLNIGSVFSRVALPGNSMYAATKFALAGCTQGLHLELRRSRIRVGLLNPGPMNTNLHAAGDGLHVPAALTTEVDVMARHAVSAIHRRAAVRTRPYRTLALIRLLRRLGRGSGHTARPAPLLAPGPHDGSGQLEDQHGVPFKSRMTGTADPEGLSRCLPMTKVRSSAMSGSIRRRQRAPERRTGRVCSRAGRGERVPGAHPGRCRVSDTSICAFADSVAYGI
jgi:hypothetical protein